MQRLVLGLMLVGLICSGGGGCITLNTGNGCGDADDDYYYDDDAGYAPGFDGSGGRGSVTSLDACSTFTSYPFKQTAADFAIVFHGQEHEGTSILGYEGPVTVGNAPDGTLELTGDSRASAVWSGVHPKLPDGAELWASFNQVGALPNPFTPAIERSNRVAPSQGGRLLAEDLIRMIPENHRFAFLNVTATVAPLCATQMSCTTRAYYTVTIHADADLTLIPGAHGHVDIDGYTYEIALGRADAVTPRDGCSATDATATAVPGLAIGGRLLRYSDIVPTQGNDPGSAYDAGSENDGG